MKKFNEFVVRVCLLGALALGAGNASAAMLSFDGPSTVTVGSTFSVDVVASGFDTLDLGGFDLDVLFDDTMLSFVDYSLGVELTDLSVGQLDLGLGEYATGVVNLAELSALLDFSAQPDEFVIATLTFAAPTKGVTTLDFGYVGLTDDLGLPITDTSLGSLDISAVPEPATALLLIPGLVGLVGLRRKS
ncbi:MAG: cohesin domain-containing protein [Chromatiales bacterium]|jgi:hypothetical protein